MTDITTIYTYNFEYDDEGNPIKAFVFSALDTPCTQMDFDRALAEGVITQQYYDALVANTYGGDVPQQTEYWLTLT
jgi:hypothetical protein